MSKRIGWWGFILLILAGCEQAAPTKPGSGSSVAKATVPPADNKSAELPAKGTNQEQGDDEKGFTPLKFNDFDVFTSDDSKPSPWSATEDGIECNGKPRGYLYSKQSYENFTLRLEYAFIRPDKLTDDSKFKGNTGFLVYITGEHKLWPACLEIQGKYSQMAAIKENGDAPPVKVTDNDQARQEARLTVGDWNALEIVSKGGAITASLNGKVISRSEPGTLREGLIGIQAEDFPFEVVNLRIRRD